MFSTEHAHSERKKPKRRRLGKCFVYIRLAAAFTCMLCDHCAGYKIVKNFESYELALLLNSDATRQHATYFVSWIHRLNCQRGLWISRVSCHVPCVFIASTVLHCIDYWLCVYMWQTFIIIATMLPCHAMLWTWWLASVYSGHLLYFASALCYTCNQNCSN